MKAGTGQSRYAPGTEYAKSYGERLRSLRMREGLSQAQVAEIMHTSQPTIGKWETGTYWPQIPDIPVLAKLYRCPLSDLMPPIPDDIIIPQQKHPAK